MTKRQRENARRRLDEDILAAIESGIMCVSTDILVHQDESIRARNIAKVRGDLSRRIVTELKRHFSITRRKA